MRVFIVGAGAMGCLYAYAFRRGGCHVTLVDTNPGQVEAINATGLKVETRAGTEVVDVRARLPQDTTGEADLILIFTKTFHTDAALDGVKHLIGPDTWLMTLQNGLGNAEALARHVDRERIMVGSSAYPSDLVAPGHIRSKGEGWSTLYPAFTTRDAFAREVAVTLNAGGFPTHLEPQIHEAIWSKAIFNAVMNPLCALTRRTPGFFFKHDESRALIREAVDEGIAAAHANGAMVDGQAIHDLTVVSMTDHADHEASMLQDVKAGRRTEVDSINGAIVRAGRAKGVECPRLETLWRLVKLEEAKMVEG
jgi:2-dehydropantoate 2-reductase